MSNEAREAGLRDEDDARALHDAIALLREPIPVDARFGARVMAFVRAAPAPSVARAGGGLSAAGGDAWRWLSTPRAIHVSPLRGLLIAAGVSALAVLSVAGPARDGGDGLTSVPPVAASPRISGTLGARTDSLVQFVLLAPEARQVVVVGDFTDWDTGRIRLQREGASGFWTATVRLPVGRHRYLFLVDGERWVADPAAPTEPKGDFGEPNSVITINGGAA